MSGPAAVTANFTGCGGGGNLVTYYSYDLLNHLTQVTMPRATGTQTRTFVYGGDYLTRAKNPENGVVVYTYNQDGTLATKIDAKSQKTVYTYDGAKRVTQIRRYTGAFQPLRVKAGRNTDYIDSSGQVWAADYGYLNGSSYTGAAGIDPLIQTERINSGTLEYQFTVPNASYSVNLIFGEIAGAQLHQRRFSIVVNGQTCASDIDVFELSSLHANWVLPYSCAATVSSGQIDIQLIPIVGSPMIGAIEITQTAGAVEDVCQRTNFYYDVNPFDGTYAQYAINRPTVRQWGGTGCATPYLFTEMYSYTPGGLATKKRLITSNGSSQSFQLETSQTYDNEGKALTVKFPDTSNSTGSTYNYTYDELARPVKLVEDYLVSGQINHRTWVDNVQYGPRNELTQIVYSSSTTETRSYNVLGQLTRIQGSMDVEYRYSVTNNNGQITQQKNWGTGEEVTYQYDSLSRLIAAATTDSAWGQAFTYDGFGNRTGATVTKGSAPSSSTVFDPLTNWAIGSGYDSNGNMTSGANVSVMSYDIDNRLVTAAGEKYGYTPDNKRIWKKKPGGDEEFYFYGIGGQKLGTYVTAGAFVVQLLDNNLYFGSKLIVSRGVNVVQDRLGSSGRFFPYGEEQQVTAQDKEKFATYYRDGTTGLDYAQNRHYANTLGRFTSPDPYKASGGPADPLSWNQYAYTRADPVNRFDPEGLQDCTPRSDGTFDCGSATGTALGYTGGFATPPQHFDRTAEFEDEHNTDTGGKPLSDKDRLRDLLWMERGWGSIKVFSTNSKDCLKDLSQFKLTPADVQKIAKSTALVNYLALGPRAQERFNPNADFTAVKLQSTFIVYNQNNFWQDTYARMLGSLLHEVIHLNNYSLGDTDIQSILGLGKDSNDTTNISTKLADDCFKNAKTP